MKTQNPPYSIARASLIPPAATGEGQAQRTYIWGDGLSERSENMNQAGLAKHVNQAGLAKHVNQADLAKHVNQADLAKHMNQAGLGSAARGWRGFGCG